MNFWQGFFLVFFYVVMLNAMKNLYQKLNLKAIIPIAKPMLDVVDR